ncbi:MAG: serine hydrolase domain-containing protein, partial [Cellulosilyticaceae bacterium]
MSDSELIRGISRGYCSDKENLVLAIGTISNGLMNKVFLGNNGVEVQSNNNTYEIGSVTKTFIASIYSDLLMAQRISLEDEIIEHVSVMQALTHTSNVGEIPFVLTDANKNGYSGYTREKVLDYVKATKIPKQKSWEYSNVGFALAGINLEDVLKESFSEIISRYIKNELGLSNTRVGESECSMTGHDYNHDPTNWVWEKDNSIVAAGGLISNIDDMLHYLMMQMKGTGAICKNPYVKTEMPFDMGLAWMIEKESLAIF